MVSSFKFLSGTVRVLDFGRRAGHIRKNKSKICGSYRVQDCTGRNDNIQYIFIMIYYVHCDLRAMRCLVFCVCFEPVGWLD